MYSIQIKKERAELKKWEEETAALRAQEREQQAARAAQLLHIQTAQVAQAEQEAANDAVYAEAANDAEYTQNTERAA